MVSRRGLIIGGVVVVAAVGIGAAVLGNKDGASKKDNFSIAMISDVGGVDDKSFNQSAWNGIKAWGKAHHLNKGVGGYDYFASKSNADFATNFQQGVSANYNVLYGVGYATNDALVAAAKKNPKTNFVLVDDVAKKQAKNIASLTFKQQESSYLAGVAAATKAKELGDDKVGFIGGMNSAVIQSFQAGYIAGVHSVDKNMKVESQFVESFTDTAKSKTIASAMYTSGMHVIFHAAGPAGNAVFTAAKDIDTHLKADAKDKVWVIGVDMDQNDQGFYTTMDGKKDNFTLTSAVKNIADSVEKIADEAKAGKFPGGKTTVYGLKDGGVSVPTNNLNDAEKQAVNKAADAIKAGKVDVPSTVK